MSATPQLVSIADVTDMLGKRLASVHDPEAKIAIVAFLQRCDFSKLPRWNNVPSTDLVPDIRKQVGATAVSPILPAER